MLTSVRPASADVILGAVAGTINAGGPGFGALSDTFDQSGLLTTYVSGVTDFDTYLSADPTHSFAFDLFIPGEWFTEAGVTDASVTYDLGGVHTINRVALWNEDASGIGLLSLYGSLDGSSFSPLSLDLSPTDNPAFADYGADVFGFGDTALRFIRFDMSECPQQPALFEGCAIGEVAFAEVAAVPEPASATLLGLGLAAVAAMRRRRATR